MAAQTVRLRHEIAGPEGAPVVLLANTLGSDLSIWDGQVDRLAEHFRVVRFDLRGHGRSPVPPGPYSIADIAGDVLGLLDELEVGRTSFCGVSIGAMTAMWLGANAPERIDRLVLSCTSAWLGPVEAWRDRAAFVRAHGTGAIAETVVDRWFTRLLKSRRPDVVEAMREMVASTPAEGYAGCAEAMGAMDLRGDLGRIAAPTLVISGAEDSATPPEHGKLIAEAIPGSSYVEVAGAAHLGIVEEPVVFGDLALDHLLGSNPPSNGISSSGSCEDAGDVEGTVEGPGLAPAQRSIATISLLTGQKTLGELGHRVAVAREEGVSAVQIKEAILIAAPFAGWPTTKAALEIVDEVGGECDN